ncbi:MAG TPA: hypothetical protein VFB60_14295 [Ktedonobacteraceae bacterium]|nr:hypothetical protein [Ktedonobacteraceae bacterium]
MKGYPVSSQNKSRYGKPSLPIRQKYLLAVLKLLIEAATIIQAKKVIMPNMLENPITYHLDSEMQKLKKMDNKYNSLFWNIRPLHEVDDPLERGEVDIKFQWLQYPALNERYLGVEAKKLFGSGPSRSFEYVTEGVMDFITCKYGQGHNYGIMLGYVVTGPFDKAIAAVDKSMMKHKKETAEQSAFVVNSSLSSYQHTYHSIHIQQGTSIAITLIHLFFDFS